MRVTRYFLFVAVLFSQCTASRSSKLHFPDGLQYKLTFSDEFKGNRLDQSKWQYRTDSKHWSTQLPENVTVADGYLYLNVKKQKAQDKEYTGAGIISKDRYRFGYYEARLKVPAGTGWHSSFWLMGYDGKTTGTTETVLELDMFENDSKTKTGYNSNVHLWKGQHTENRKWVETTDLSQQFHTFGCAYSATEIKYYVDGMLDRSIDVSKMPHGDLNIWLTTIATFIGETKAVDESKLPGAFVVDYVRYYEPVGPGNK